MTKYKIDPRTYFFIKKSLLSQVEPKDIIKNAPDENLPIILSKFIQDDSPLSLLELRYILNTQTDYDLPRIRRLDTDFIFDLSEINEQLDGKKLIQYFEANSIDIVRVLSVCTSMPDELCKKKLIDGEVSKIILLDILHNQVSYL